jgi:hypothetical protein
MLESYYNNNRLDDIKEEARLTFKPKPLDKKYYDDLSGYKSLIHKTTTKNKQENKQLKQNTKPKTSFIGEMCYKSISLFCVIFVSV